MYKRQALQQLTAIKKLRWVDVSDTGVSDAAIEQFKQALPEVSVRKSK